ncbi:MAG: sugar-binding transcriptional regulator [Pseudomonadota bacterium]
MVDLTEAERMTRAAWLYYVAGLNQAETAHRLGVTRARVNRLLQGARQTGVVAISVNERDLGLLKVEEALRVRFGLDTCIATVPVGGNGSHADQEATLRLVGAAGAQLMQGRLAADPSMIIGIGWGRTLAALAHAFPGPAAPEARFISLMGSLTAKSSVNPFDVVQELAKATGGEGYFLPVPFIADTPQDRAFLLSQQAIKAPLALARRAQCAFISVGELTSDSLLVQKGMIGEDDLAELRAAGAVGDTNGIFFDAAGVPVAHPLNQRCVALGLDALRSMETVLLSAGRQKLNATRALLESGAIRTLVIDGDSALALSRVSGASDATP